MQSADWSSLYSAIRVCVGVCVCVGISNTVLVKHKARLLMSQRMHADAMSESVMVWRVLVFTLGGNVTHTSAVTV